MLSQWEDGEGDTIPSLGEFISKCRKEAGMSQENLAQDICSRAYLSRIERNYRIPSPLILGRLSDRLELPLTTAVDVYLSEPGITVNQLLQLTTELARRDHLDEARELLSQAKDRLERLDLADEYRVDYLETQAYLHFRDGCYGVALDLYQQVLESRKKRPSERFQLARSYFLVGNTAIYAGDFVLARSMLFLALGHVLSVDPKQAPERSETVIEIHAKIVQAIGYVLLDRHEFEAADSMLSMALLRWQEMEIFPDIPVPTLINMGFAKIGTGRLDEARNMFERIVASGRADGYEAHALNNLGLTFRLLGRPAEALACQLNAWEIHCDRGEGFPQAIANELAHCYLKMGDLENSRRWLEKAEETAHDAEALTRANLAAETAMIKADMARTAGEDPCSQQEWYERAGSYDISQGMRNVLLVKRAEAALHAGDIGEALEFLSRLYDNLYKYTI